MSRKLSIIALLCAAILLPSIAAAQLSVFAKQRVVIADVIDRNDRPLNPAIIKLILQGYTDMISGSEEYEVYQVNINEIKSRLKERHEPTSFANISKEIGKQADYIVFTTVKSSSSAIGGQSSNVTIFISTSLYRISTASEVLADQDKCIPFEQPILSTSSALISRMLGLKKKPGTQQTQQTQQTQRAVSHTQQEKVWKIGDYYDVDGKRGVVFAVTPDGKHGKILSLTKTSANWDAAKSWCRNLGNGWRLASKDELIVMYRHKRTLNSILQAVGDVFGYNGCYWTLDERGSDSAWTVYMSDGSTYNYRKSNNGYVRAVSAF